jgi:hypothetical protein
MALFHVKGISSMQTMSYLRFVTLAEAGREQTLTEFITTENINSMLATWLVTEVLQT